MRWLVTISFGFFHFMRLNLVISILLAASGGLFAQTAPDLRVLSESPTSIVLEFKPTYTNRVVAGSDGKRYTIYDFHSSVIDPGAPGSLRAPYRPVLINMPTARFTVQVIAQDYKDIAAANPATQPAWKQSGGFGLGPVYVSPNPRLISGDRLPVQVAQLVNVGRSRGFLLGTLKMSPLQFSFSRNEVRIYSRLVVRIDFASAVAGSLPVSSFLRNRFPAVPSNETAPRMRKISSDSPLAQGDWYRMEVNETGIYKIDQSFLTKAGIALSSIGNINSIRIFGNGGKEIPLDLTLPQPNGLEEVARLVVDKNGNGTFDADDYILFYGRGTRGWNYSPSERTFHHYINHFTETSVYFMTFGGSARGKTMDSLVSTSIANAYKPDDYQGKVFLEEELNKPSPAGKPTLNSGQEWVGRPFDDVNNINSFVTTLPGFVPNRPTEYRFVFLTSSSSNDAFTVQENGTTLGDQIPMYAIDVGSITDPYAYRTDVVSRFRTGSLPNNRSVLRMQFLTNNSAALGWLDWFEILYRRQLSADSDLLLFTSPDTTSVVQYLVSNFSSRDISLFDVTDHRNVKQVTNLVFDAANASLATFQVPQTAGSVREFVAVGPTGYKTAANVKRVPNSNLHGFAGGSYFVIISPSDFLSEAERLRAHREQTDTLKPVVVNIDQIYNEFSSGMLDPLAIREFLRYTQSAWSPRPEYVLLFGAGNYDYKKIKSSATNWIPPYETLESRDQIATLASDDYFAILDSSSQRISVAIGRIPVRSLDTARAVVDKIISYDTSRAFDPWRNRITFAADDGLTTTGDDGELHTDQAETLAQDDTPDGFTKNKIYIVEYPTVNTSTGRTKPTANVAIDDAINQGTLILNWTGHGNTQQWAHEKVFAVDEDFPLLNNKGKYFFLVAATCDFARYDNPGEVSAGEQLILMPNRGAVAEVTADRVVYSELNAELNRTLYQNLFQTDSKGKPLRLGDAMWQTKQLLYGQNDQKHHLFGDPTMRLAIPGAQVSVDSVNGQNASTLVTVGALARVKVHCSLKSSSGGSLSSVQGTAILEAYDSKRTVPVDLPGWDNFTFVLNGSLIYRGKVSVRNGSVQGTFPVPKDVSYGNDRSRINIYAWNDSTDATGYTENLSIAGTAAASVDTVGPSVQIYFGDRSFRPGDVVGPDATMIVDLTDSSGINTSTAGIGHKLEATLDGSQRTIDLTNYYRGNLDTYQSGQAQYEFSGLPEGRHSLAVKAWDIYNNSSSAETYFEVRSTSQLAIYNVVNFPNPFARSTTFTFQRSSTDPIDVEIKIYTVAGRMIQDLQSPSVTDRFVEVPWDGRDRDGNEIANGVYLYRVIAKSFDRSSTSEALGKLAVLR